MKTEPTRFIVAFMGLLVFWLPPLKPAITQAEPWRILIFNSHHLNQPYPYYDDYRAILGAAIIFVAFETFVILYLLLNTFRRRQAEQALQQRVNQLALLSEIGGQIVAVLELDNVLIRAVQLVQENFGYHHVAIFTLDYGQGRLGMRAKAGTYTALFPPDYTLKLNEGMVGWAAHHNQTLLANDVAKETHYENSFPGEGEIITRSELSVPIQIRGGVIGVLDVQSPQRNAFDQNDLLVLKTLADQIAVAMENARLYEAIKQELNERRQAEEALRASEAKYRQLVEYAPAGICEIDFVQNRFISVNDVMCEYSGYTREEFLALNPFALLVGESRKHFIERQQKLFSGQPVPDIVECKIRGKNSREFWVLLNMSHRYKEGEPVSATVVAHDITERRQIEAEIRKLNVELEQRVLQRTAQLEAANKELETFAYSVSHDLRAPLRSINGFSQALLDEYAGVLGEMGQDYLHRVLAASRRMGQLIDDLLKLSRLTRGELHRLPVQLSVLAQEIVADLQQTQPKRAVDFIITPDIVVKGDEQLLRAALENLLGNAWKFSRQRSRAKIEFGRTEINDEPVYFIRDNGAGFDMAYADKLFGAFQRLHRDTEFEGVGIGLATVQRIIHRHGGRIWAEAGVDKGATFYFTL